MYFTVTDWFAVREPGSPVVVPPEEVHDVDARSVVEVTVISCPSMSDEAAGSVIAREAPAVPTR
jgi:hypothetical protein